MEIYIIIYIYNYIYNYIYIYIDGNLYIYFMVDQPD